VTYERYNTMYDRSYPSIADLHSTNASECTDEGNGISCLSCTVQLHNSAKKYSGPTPQAVHKVCKLY